MKGILIPDGLMLEVGDPFFSEGSPKSQDENQPSPPPSSPDSGKEPDHSLAILITIAIIAIIVFCIAASLNRCNGC